MNDKARKAATIGAVLASLAIAPAAAAAAAPSGFDRASYYGDAPPAAAAEVAPVEPEPAAEPEHAEPEPAAAEPEHADTEPAAEPEHAEPEPAVALRAQPPEQRLPEGDQLEVAQQKDSDDGGGSEEDCSAADLRHSLAMTLGRTGELLILSNQNEAAAPLLDAMEDLLGDNDDGCVTFSPDDTSESEEEQE